MGSLNTHPMQTIIYSIFLINTIQFIIFCKIVWSNKQGLAIIKGFFFKFPMIVCTMNCINFSAPLTAVFVWRLQWQCFGYLVSSISYFSMTYTIIHTTIQSINQSITHPDLLEDRDYSIEVGERKISTTHIRCSSAEKL